MLSVKFREMRTKEMFELGEFRLPWTRMAHAWVYVWMRMGIKPPAVLSIRPSWSSPILLIFSFFLSRKENPKHRTPLFTNTVPNFAPCCVSRPGLWPPEQCHPFERGGQVGLGGRTWEGGRVTWVPLSNLSMTSHPPLAIIWLFSLGFFMARWDAVGTGGHSPHPLFQMVQSVKGRGLSLRRCCWRSWMWRPRPCPRCPRRPQTCGCEAWGRGHWPAGAHQYGPPYGKLDSAL